MPPPLFHDALHPRQFELRLEMRAAQAHDYPPRFEWTIQHDEQIQEQHSNRLATARSTKSGAAGMFCTSAAVNLGSAGGRRANPVIRDARCRPGALRDGLPNVDLLRCLDDACRECRHRFDEMLASIEG